MSISPEVYVEIVQRYAALAHAFDQGDGEAFAQVFTAAGTFSRPGGDVLTGHAELLEYVHQRAAEAPGIRHLVCDVMLREEGDTVRGTAYGVILGVDDAGSLALKTVGLYDDVFVEEGGAWRLSSRDFTSIVAAGQAGIKLTAPTG